MHMVSEATRSSLSQASTCAGPSKSSSCEERSLVSSSLMPIYIQWNRSASSVAGGHTSLRIDAKVLSPESRSDISQPYSNDIVDGQVCTQPREAKIEEVTWKHILKYPFMKDDVGCRYVSRTCMLLDIFIFTTGIMDILNNGMLV